jgi:hypothetical protein
MRRDRSHWGILEDRGSLTRCEGVGIGGEQMGRGLGIARKYGHVFLYDRINFVGVHQVFLRLFSCETPLFPR